MDRPIWVGSLDNIKYDDAAIDAIKNGGDADNWIQGAGIIKVSKLRWLSAQQFERSGWMDKWLHVSDDRSKEHYKLFDSYNAVWYDLGDVLEVGCGPFTQLRTILCNRIAKSITLQDPLINQYFDHPHCGYSDGTISDIPISPINMMLEDYVTNDEFDTLVCINVLEHTMDVELCFRNMLKALKNGGTIIFGERWYDDFDPSKHYCVGHPIRICKSVVDNFKKNFDILFERDDVGYFIGRKINGVV